MIFFYTGASAECATDCNYKTCPRRYYLKLQAKADAAELYPLAGVTPYDFYPKYPVPQHGDIVILYAQGSKELVAMNESCEGLEGMKKVLVVGDSAGIDGSMYHKLSPRYITQANRNIEELELVIKKMKIQTSRIS